MLRRGKTNRIRPPATPSPPPHLPGAHPASSLAFTAWSLRPEEEPQDMQPYEVMVMIDAEAEDGRQDEIIDRIRQTVEKAGGTFESVDAWGRRKLAYEIDHKSEAFYHVVAFTTTPEA